MFEWLDKRLLIRESLCKPSLPRGRSSWQYFPGFMTFLLFIAQFITGIWLSFDFSLMSMPDNTSIIFKFHHVGAHLLLVFMTLQVLRNLFVGAYQQPREFHWLLLVAIFFLTWFNYYLALLLRPEISEKTYLAIKWLYNFSFMTSYLPNDGKMTLPQIQNIFILHALVIPLVTYTLFLCYLWLLQRTGLECRSKD
ncbi:cytochrome b N-terminal domain-containing protein [Candidatus Uabimicrobium sp. HlEnr_7]|uniref:cytochrome b N-terminal domain-containing protein n=1 Tax=Candidatus Uabimicrobium helgolandensis TaxID=3095367 RepID=UPI003556224F